jgi:hypothetical protein
VARLKDEGVEEFGTNFSEGEVPEEETFSPLPAAGGSPIADLFFSGSHLKSVTPFLLSPDENLLYPEQI